MLAMRRSSLAFREDLFLLCQKEHRHREYDDAEKDTDRNLIGYWIGKSIWLFLESFEKLLIRRLQFVGSLRRINTGVQQRTAIRANTFTTDIHAATRA